MRSISQWPVLSNTTTQVYPGPGSGPYVQQGCAQGVVLCCTVVLAEGGYKRGGEQVWPLGP
jgi:hypothetical protein